ncbi:MAG: dockerin type I repeat-containing protein [Firmicutes bacterium]|nr:dockerin type I repeat-containing protein [Bacillota bacterium]
MKKSQKRKVCGIAAALLGACVLISAPAFTHFSNILLTDVYAAEHSSVTPQKSGDYYLINNADELYGFAEIANSGSASAKLMADITINTNLLNSSNGLNTASAVYTWTPIGNISTPYQSTFDGNGHTISGLYINDNTLESCGLFGTADGATIQNLTVKDSYISGSNAAAGGIAGQCYGDIRNSSFTGYVSGKNAGGIAGETYIAVIDSVYSLASVRGSAMSGSFAGSASNSTITNVCASGELFGESNSNSITNAYVKDAAAFSSGEVCWILNKEASVGAWYQTLGTDSAPVLDSQHKTLYKNGYTDFDNKTFLIGSYSNTAATVNPDVKTIDGAEYYVLTNYAELVWFSKQVNGGNKSINAFVENDITANTSLLKADDSLNTANAVYKWTPAGNTSTSFQGIFDGNNKTIKGIYADTDSNNVGLFGNIAGNGVVKNLDIKDSYIKGTNDVGSISGSCTYLGSIKNCTSSAAVYGNSGVGGITGSCGGNAEVSGCYTTGNVYGSTNSGGVVGTVADASKNAKNSCSKFSPAVGSASIVSVSSKTDKQFASGEVCSIINGNITDGTQTWYQTIGKDSLPVRDDTHGTVYSQVYTDFDNTPFEGGVYSNKSGTDPEPATKTVDGVEYYIISSYPELVWFSKQVLNGKTTINAMLGSDITANEDLLTESGFNAANRKYIWTPAGKDSGNAFAGIFDGNGCTISGLYIEKATQGTGLFGYLKGSVKNVCIKDTYISGYSYVGTIAGYASGTIENCGAESIIIASNAAAGGIAGGLFSSTISNCHSSGSVTASNNAGGIIGYIYNSKLNNSYSLSTTKCTGNNMVNKGGIAGNALLSTLTACYSLDAPYRTALEGTASKTAAQFASGEVCWLLNNSTAMGAWYQTIGSDDAPVLDSTHLSVLYDGKEYSNKLLGDTDLNGKVENKDAVMLLKHINKAYLTKEQLAAADRNGDGTADMLDVIGILKTVR